MIYPSKNESLTAKQSIPIDKGFWDIEDLSHYLNVKLKTIYSMVTNIPHYRIGKLIRFKKVEIDSWLESKRESAQNIKKILKKRKLNESSNNNIDALIRKTIDQTKQEDYNSSHGKSDRIEAQGKEN
jgi:excisionase family DNA binding protein